jgi:hypothetical protein
MEHSHHTCFATTALLDALEHAEQSPEAQQGRKGGHGARERERPARARPARRGGGEGRGRGRRGAAQAPALASRPEGDGAAHPALCVPVLGCVRVRKTDRGGTDLIQGVPVSLHRVVGKRRVLRVCARS